MQKRVLIVEDSKDIQMLLCRFLNLNGYEVDCANNGKQAVEMIESAEQKPGLILLDLMMPVMDGRQFLEMRKTIPMLSEIPVVIMTADGHFQARELKVEGFLKKPFMNIDLILETIGKFFVSTVS